jgi:tRNA1Val (adenine37-N6)-methyltransferase
MPSCRTALDIGSGTGLLMLMLAQKNKAAIDGIELDTIAFKQLQENIAQSKWKDRLAVFAGDVRSWPFSIKYDFIITNPPFFEGDLLSGSVEKNLARHSKELSLEELLTVIDKNLNPAGSFGILLPYHRAEYFENLALRHHFFVTEKLSVRQTPAHDFFRSIMHFSRTPQNASSSFELSIKNGNQEYTDEFVELMKDYYLHLAE